MKKFLALAMAFAMAMSMTAVSFAADPTGFDVDETAYVYDADAHTFTKVTTTAPARFGDEVTYQVKVGDGATDFFSDPDYAKNIKLKTNWEVGSEYVEGVKLLKKVDTSGKAYYYVVLTIKESPKETEEKDIIGTITVSSSKYDAKGKEKDINVALTVSNKTTDSIDKMTDDDHVFKFGDGDEEQEIELYGEMGKFVVDTRGQEDIVVNSNVKYNKGIENVAPDVNYTYFNGNGATFNKIGTLYLDAKEDNIVYKVNSDGTLSKLDATYDEDEEAFAIRTRVLGSYVIAEKELDLSAVNVEDETAATPAPSAPSNPSNPTTGAAC